MTSTLTGMTLVLSRLCMTLVVTVQASTAQERPPAQTYEEAAASFSEPAELEAWLQRNAGGLIQYEFPPTDGELPPVVDLNYRRSHFYEYTWSNCSLTVREAPMTGMWLAAKHLEETASVSMLDVDGVGSGVTSQREGRVVLYLAESGRSRGNLPRGRAVSLEVRYPQLVSSLVLWYTTLCKLR